MSKIIIVNWKWKKDYPRVYNSTNDNKVVFLNYKKDNNEDTKEFYNEILRHFTQSEVLVCCHLSHPNNISTNELLNIDEKQILHGVTFHDFKGDGSIPTPLYIDKKGFGLLHNDYQEFDQYEKIVLNGEEIPEANFNSVWSIIPAEQKKKLINLWLPLAIDLQGLKDNNKGHLKDYFEAIQKDVREYGNEEYLQSWNKLKDTFPSGVKKLLDDDLPSKIVASLTAKETTADDFYKNYVENSDGNNFLPNWLQEVVSVIDSKINEYK